MKKIKLLYHEDGRLLYSAFFPDVPPIKASVYADMAAMNTYDRQIKNAILDAMVVKNPEKAFEIISFTEPVERDRIYEIECEFTEEYVQSSMTHYITIL